MQEATRVLTGPGGRFEIAELVIAGRKTRYWRTMPQTIRELVERLRVYGERDYLVYEGERLTYAAAFEQVATLAARLQDTLAIAKGDRVAIAMRNLPEWPLALWAITSIGAIAVPLNAWWQDEELAYGLQDSGAKAVFADTERVARIREHAEALGLTIVAVRAEAPAGGFTFEDLLAAGEPVRALPAADVRPEDDATIFYTSGTTGRPKGALGTHRNLCTNIGSMGFVRSRAALRRGQEPPVTGPEGTPTASLISVPFFHVTGCHSRLAYGTYMGSKLVLMHKWNAEQALELIERERITAFGGVPATVWQLLESPELSQRDTSSVVGVSYGGAPAAPELVRRLLEAFPDASPANGYGLTETSAVTTTNAGMDYVQRPDSVGPAVPVCDVKIIDEQGEALPTGGVGQLCIRGPNVIKGYWNRPEATAEAIRDGWLHTGDVARLDEDGFVYILDRAKDMLIRGGENVYCVEVESALHTHPGVLDVAVIGVAHHVLGEEVGAVVQVRQGTAIESLSTHAKAHLAHFKVPVRWSLRDEPLPRNPNGKILKRQLRHELGWDVL